MIIGDNFQDIYLEILKNSLENSILWAKAKVQNKPIQFCLLDATNSLINFPKNWKWAIHEAINRISFEHSHLLNPGTAFEFRPNWKRKLEKEGGTFTYSYGELYKEQIDSLKKELKKSSSRESILSVWDSSYLVNQKDFPRRPCTLNLHFTRVHVALDLHVYMRTVDIMNMLPYDVFHHSFLQRYLASIMGYEIGKLYFTASFGYYQKKRDITNSVVNTLEKLSTKSKLIPTKDWGFNEEDRKICMLYTKDQSLSVATSQYSRSFFNALRFSYNQEGIDYMDEFEILRNK